MTKNSKRTFGALVLSGLMTLPGTYLSAQDVDACARNAQTHTLTINETDNVPTSVRRGNTRMDDLVVCPGDTVAWILQGRGFTISFPAGTPFDVDEHRADAQAGRVSAVVRADVARGASFKYAISLEGGGVLDPRIIIQD